MVSYLALFYLCHNMNEHVHYNYYFLSKKQSFIITFGICVFSTVPRWLSVCPESGPIRNTLFCILNYVLFIFCYFTFSEAKGITLGKK